jgi:hypothetical protein
MMVQDLFYQDAIKKGKQPFSKIKVIIKGLKQFFNTKTVH